MIPAVEIELDRVEGPKHDIGAVRLVGDGVTSVWEMADDQLRRWSHTAPKEGGYDKIDFKIRYKDGYVYEGRFDLGSEPNDLASHVRSFASFASGRRKPARLTQEQYEIILKRDRNVTREMADLLDNYKIGA